MSFAFLINKFKINKLGHLLLLPAFFNSTTVIFFHDNTGCVHQEDKIRSLRTD